ncbi:MAG: hypothetical protein CVU88_03925, partial [Firmicutes bacterium HGW-Firmicutes-13]
EPDLVMETLRDVNPSFSDMAYVFGFAGQGLSMCGDFNDAEHYLRRATALEPDNSELRFNLAMTYVMNNKPYEAANEMEKVDLTGMSRESMDKARTAKALFEKAVEENRREHGLSKEEYLRTSRIFNKAFALLCKGDYAESIKKFEDVIAIEPDSYRCFGNIGIAYLKQGDFKKAREYLMKALSIKPDYACAKNNLESLEQVEKGGKGGIGIPIALLTPEEKKLVNFDPIHGKGLEAMMQSVTFYRAEDGSRILELFKNNKEFEVVDEGKHFVEAVWRRKDRRSITRNIFPDASESFTVLGHLTLRWGELRLETMSAGRMRILQNILLEKCGLKGALEFEEEYFEDLMSRTMKEETEDDLQDDDLLEEDFPRRRRRRVEGKVASSEVIGDSSE